MAEGGHTSRSGGFRSNDYGSSSGHRSNFSGGGGFRQNNNQRRGGGWNRGSGGGRRRDWNNSGGSYHRKPNTYWGGINNGGNEQNDAKLFDDAAIYEGGESSSTSTNLFWESGNETPNPGEPLKFEEPETQEHTKIQQFWDDALAERKVVNNKLIDCRVLHSYGEVCQFCDGRRGDWVRENKNVHEGSNSFLQYQQEVVLSLTEGRKNLEDNIPIAADGAESNPEQNPEPESNPEQNTEPESNPEQNDADGLLDAFANRWIE